MATIAGHLNVAHQQTHRHDRSVGGHQRQSMSDVERELARDIVRQQGIVTLGT